MPGNGHRTACFVLSLAWVCACAKHDRASRPGGASATAAASAAPRASEPKAVPHVEQAKPACRALAVTGLATVDGAPLTTSALLDGAHWVELAAGATVALRHTVTSREFKLIGPGHALPCRAGSEQVLLADGQLSTSANLGVRPGAEVLIATPEGVVHYGDAALDVEFGANACVSNKARRGSSQKSEASRTSRTQCAAGRRRVCRARAPGLRRSSMPARAPRRRHEQALVACSAAQALAVATHSL